MSARAIVLSLLRRTAKRGERCPTETEIKEYCNSCGCGYSANARVATLAAAGLLVSRVYARNWRVVVIDGHSTALPPDNRRLYRVVDASGTRYVE